MLALFRESPASLCWIRREGTSRTIRVCGEIIMRLHQGETGRGWGAIHRRDSLHLIIGAAMGMAGAGSAAGAAQGGNQGETTDPHAAEADLEAARGKLVQAGIGPIATVRSVHYQAIGDAPEGFMKLTLLDCEQLAQDYQKHFRARGFQVHQPERRLTVVVFQDSRSFARFFPAVVPQKTAGRGATVQRVGNYSRATNMLYVFDWRMVPMEPRSSHRNTETLAHEGIHQLTYNTGLLNRAADTPLCIVEGLGMYGEARQVRGSSDLGRINLRRLDDLARTQRMVPWIPVRDLFTDDTILQSGRALRVLLAYAQSWLLAYYLMKTPETLPKFRDYLKAIETRTKADKRLEDARAHLGDLDALDHELRLYAIRLHRSI
jgi:hypothetical protein